MKDRYGFTTVDLNQVGYRDEPFLVGSQVSQVFYVRNTRNKKWQVVLPRKKRVVGLKNPVDEEGFNQSNEVPPLDTSTVPVILASELTPYLRDGRTEVAPMSKRRQKWQLHKKTCSCEFLNNVQSHFLANNIYLSSLLLTIWCYLQKFRKGFWLMREVHVIKDVNCRMRHVNCTR